MATPYSDIFKRFLNKIDDDLYSALTQTEGEYDMSGLMNASILLIKFPRQDLARDNTLKEFSEDLVDTLQELISVAMKYEWSGRQIYRIENTKQKFTQSDFKLTSQQAHLDRLIVLHNHSANELKIKVMNRSYVTNGSANWSGLAGGK